MADHLYLALRDKIMADELQAGTRLREIEVSQRFGMSRTPVREAFKKLEAEGFIVDGPGAGFTVANPSLSDICDGYLVRQALEGLAARLAADRASDSEVMILQSIFRQMVEANESGDTSTAVNLAVEFDQTIFNATRIPRLIRTIEGYRAYHGAARRANMYEDERRRNSIEERRIILDAIVRRDVEAAESAAQEHLRKACENRIEQAIGGGKG